MINKISVAMLKDDPKADHLKNEIESFLHIDLKNKLKIVKNFYLQGNLTEALLSKIAKDVVSCQISESYKINEKYYLDAKHELEISFLKGVMNPETQTLKKELSELGIEYEEVMITYSYYFYDSLKETDLQQITEKILMNKQIEEVVSEPFTDLSIHLTTHKAEIIKLREMNDQELMELSNYKLFLTLEEMHAIKDYFTTIARDPFDVELETLAQTWSEHCCHKTFKAKFILDGVEKDSLFSMVKNAEKEINHPDIISKFKDNAGIFKFTDDYGICIKAETHNSPSGLDPYGGAMTGTGGVFRDIAGTGKGAKNISSIDIFCLGDIDASFEDLPSGSLHPRRILSGVVNGVRDYGNRMGVPTNNGSFHFHPDFGPKPTVLVGADGLIPLKYASKDEPQKGDLVVSFGGKTGRDGIHGATFSSAEMTEKTSTLNSNAVQIGNAIEEKRVFDCLLEIRDQDLIRTITDCGAGGYSSAVGELAEKTGVEVELNTVPLKYSGLRPFEIWISESQERMVAIIEPKNYQAIEKIAKKYNVDCFVLGTITDDQKLKIYYNGELTCDLDMKFLHDGQPTDKIIAKTYQKEINPEPEFYEEEVDYNSALKDILSHLNVASKEPVIRQYDHGVQGTTVQGPLCGRENDGPTGGAVLKPLPDSDKALILGHGINPLLNRLDSYTGSEWAFYEAISNVVALGGDPSRVFMVENYIWPKPTEKNLSDLYNCVKAVTDLSVYFKMPIISGKDSLSSTYKNKDKVIEVPPVICMSARAVSDDYNKTISPDFKKSGSPILLVGDYQGAELGGSIFAQRLEKIGNKVPTIKKEVAKKVYDLIYKGITNGDIISASDVSEGGAITALCEMAIGAKKGFNLTISDKVKTLFAEVPASFVVEVKDLDAADRLIESELAVQIGTTTSTPQIVVNDFKMNKIIDLELKDIAKVWKEPFQKYF